MARINLLPWREELRAQWQKAFLTANGYAAGLTLALLFYLHMHISGLIENQNIRNQFLQSEISALDTKIKAINKLDEKKRRLIGKMNVIQRLQSSRPEIIHLFDEVAKTVPDGVFIQSFIQAGKDLTVKGSAQSNARVSTYMRKLEASPWLKNSQLTIIETKQGSKRSRQSNFILRVKQGKDEAKKEVKKT